MSRPVLLPGIAALWRGPRTLQLGLDPQRAVVLEFGNPATARLLPLLDGARTESAVLAEATRRGVDEADARALLDTLRSRGLVVAAHTLLPSTMPERMRGRLGGEATALALRGADAPGTPAAILRRRAGAGVKITGRGRLALPIAVALAAAGVGHLDPRLDGRIEPGEPATGGLTADYVRRPREQATIEAIGRVSPGTRVGPLRRADTSFVVQVGMTAPARLHAMAYRQHRMAHLAVTMRDGTAVVGPLVPPRGAPCLNCLELHRRDRDPVWPSLAAQLATAYAGAPHAGVLAPAGPPSPARPGDGVSEACPATTAFVAAGYAAAEVLRYLDGEAPHTLGVTVEISAAGVDRRRSWAAHPECDCVGRRRSTARPAVTHG
ncbi:MAG TPA: PqqD family protein [Micromonosporaceae bacterium]|nr:PqqD family protein [Micromonosporaceae bacterium]